MDARERREEILRSLNFFKEPITGSTLAARFDVTRQIIVQDIAILRAQGANVLSTPKGYMVMAGKPSGIAKIVAVKHRRKDTAQELYAMVDCGVEIVDVIVDHPVYGQLTGQLSIESRMDVDSFLKTMEHTKAGLLSSLTDGVHLHTIRGKKPQYIHRALEKLENLGFLLEE